MLNKESESNDDCPKITIETGDDLNVTDCVMTAKQKLILDQQLRQHVQLCTQHFLQLYGHPELWSLAETCKQNLVNENSLFYVYIASSGLIVLIEI